MILLKARRKKPKSELEIIPYLFQMVTFWVRYIVHLCLRSNVSVSL